MCNVRPKLLFFTYDVYILKGERKKVGLTLPKLLTFYTHIIIILEVGSTEKSNLNIIYCTCTVIVVIRSIVPNLGLV